MIPRSLLSSSSLTSSSSPSSARRRGPAPSPFFPTYMWPAKHSQRSLPSPLPPLPQRCRAQQRCCCYLPATLSRCCSPRRTVVALFLPPLPVAAQPLPLSPPAATSAEPIADAPAARSHRRTPVATLIFFLSSSTVGHTPPRPLLQPRPPHLPPSLPRRTPLPQPSLDPRCLLLFSVASAAAKP
ncbi:hypothetical protein GW17_00049084, partial [Ensete ventricosum]